MKKRLALVALLASAHLPAAFSSDTCCCNHSLVDSRASELTRRLYHNLGSVAETATLFGAQETMAYGHDWKMEEGNSDVKLVTGSYPAVYGWDVGGFESTPDMTSGIGYGRAELVRWSKEAQARGGVVTYAWHMSNPVSGKSFYDKTPAVAAIIPGGKLHEQYKRSLDNVAGFFAEIAPTPIIFRPFHEHNGNWFWWGKGLCTEAEYIELWRFTVEYLRDEKGLRNLIYAFSPDRSRMDLDDPQAYFYAYPGDDYVDIIGLDNYWDVGHDGNRRPAEENAANFVRSLELIVDIAAERGKVPALTETGSDTLPDPNWYTQVLLKGIDANEKTRRIAYVQVWRNANAALENREHFYVPYPGHPAAPDFIAFKNAPTILFEDELPDLYAKPESCAK